jgi:hypothetical protein
MLYHQVMSDLGSDPVFLITGASSGIGPERAIAVECDVNEILIRPTAQDG